MAIKARVRLVCPICEQDLSCFVRVVNSNDASWALDEKSTKHLAEAHL